MDRTIFAIELVMRAVQPAWLSLAYIDPSTGGTLFQMLALVFALFSTLLFFFSRKIKALFARLRRFFVERMGH